MNYLKSVRMDDHSILMAVTALISAIGLKEIWAIVQKRMDIGAQKNEREGNLYTEQIKNLTEKIEQLETKIQKLIEENTQLLVKVARMEEKLITNAKRRVQTRRKKDERN